MDSHFSINMKISFCDLCSRASLDALLISHSKTDNHTQCPITNIVQQLMHTFIGRGSFEKRLMTNNLYNGSGFTWFNFVWNHHCRADRRGQPSIYFPIGDHVNVSWCCSHTNASGVISTSHIVASHITKLLLSFRQILQFRF